MKIKRLLARFLVIIMCFLLASCNNDTDDKKPSTPKNDKQTTEMNSEQESENDEVSQEGAVTPLLYRITDEKGNVIWLFGSIHVGREDYYPLPDYVQDAFDKADSLAVEVDIVAFEKDMKLQMEALSSLVYYDGSKITDYISQELYEKSVGILREYKSYAKAMDMYCPAFWGSMIESLMLEELGGDVQLGIDRHLIDKAYESEKDIIEIESAKFQYKMLADFEDDIQRMLLESAVQAYENKDAAAADLEGLMDLWASGNENAFIEYLNATDDTMADEEKQMYEKYDQTMIRDRNLAMADYAEEALLSGKEIFICVGAAHIVGDGAMADILSQRGYTVECIVK